jgi:lactoylglutathione lyase
MERLGRETCPVKPRRVGSNIVFACENIEAYCTELKTRGVTFTEELSKMAWGKFASFRDDDGNEFGLKES